MIYSYDMAFPTYAQRVAAEQTVRPETPAEYAARMADPVRRWLRAEARYGTHMENLADPD